jgi:hypothetical protein
MTESLTNIVEAISATVQVLGPLSFSFSLLEPQSATCSVRSELMIGHLKWIDRGGEHDMEENPKLFECAISVLPPSCCRDL